MPNIYIVCYHSEPGRYATNSRSSGQFLLVEQEIVRGSWPYDNGDDPSFFVTRREGGPLTWGVCRQNVRRHLKHGSIVVFFAYERQRNSGMFHYRLSGAATVADPITHATAGETPSLATKPYLNVLIRHNDRENRWVHDEGNRPRGAQHDDWLWRIADHTGLRKSAFKEVQRQGWFDEHTLVGGRKVVLESNYIVFSNEASKTVILEKPPVIATASNGASEQWTCPELRDLTIGVAGQYGQRQCLRTRCRYGPAHPHIAWSMTPECADQWFSRFTSALRAIST